MLLLRIMYFPQELVFALYNSDLQSLYTASFTPDNGLYMLEETYAVSFTKPMSTGPLPTTVMYIRRNCTVECASFDEVETAYGW